MGVLSIAGRKGRRPVRKAFRSRSHKCICGILLLLAVVALMFSTFQLNGWSLQGLGDYYGARFPAGLLKRGPGGGTLLEVRPRNGDRPLRLSQLREFCALYAPGLQMAEWSGWNLTRFPATLNKSDFQIPPCPLLPKPVCFRHDVVYYDGVDVDSRRDLNGTGVRVGFVWKNLTSASFRQLQNDTSIEKLTVVPAMGLIPLGRFVLGQLYHIMNDLVKPVMSLMADEESETSGRVYTELGRSPTQFFTFPHKRLMWPRAKLLQAVPQTAHFMGAFSHPTAPLHYFFEEAPVLNNNTVYCTCQAMLIGENKERNVIGRKQTAFRLASELVLRYMNETPYESVSGAAGGGSRRAERVPLPILRRFSHVPHIAQRFWTTEAEAMNGTTVVAPSYRPRLLLINRRRRNVHNTSGLVTLAERVGFNVQVVWLESMSLEEQYHVGRHADVMMGMHGMGLTHVLWMDGRRRSGCRALIELMPFGCPQKLVHFYSAFSASVGIHYEYMEAADMYFEDGPKAANITREQETQEIKSRMLTCDFKWSYRGFADQTAVYNMSAVEDRLMAAYTRLTECGIV